MKMKKNKGITLVALIITVIVMLILVGVTISAVVQSDIIGQGEQAGNAYKEKQAEEQSLNPTYDNKTVKDYLDKVQTSTNNDPEPEEDFSYRVYFNDEEDDGYGLLIITEDNVKWLDGTWRNGNKDKTDTFNDIEQLESTDFDITDETELGSYTVSDSEQIIDTFYTNWADTLSRNDDDVKAALREMLDEQKTTVYNKVLYFGDDSMYGYIWFNQDKTECGMSLFEYGSGTYNQALSGEENVTTLLEIIENAPTNE